MLSKHCLLTNSNIEPLKLNISDAIQLVNAPHWESIVGTDKPYLSLPYLMALESSLSNQIDFRYILFYDELYQPVGVAVVQLHRLTSNEIDYSAFASQIGDLIPTAVLNKMDVRIMLCGNAFATGEHGYLFCDSLSKEIAIEHLINALHRIKKDEKRSNDQVSLVLLKDFWPSSFDTIKVFESDKFRQIGIDVNMVIKIRKTWKTWDDYLGDLTTKFRTKAKGVYKKSQIIEKREFSANDIQIHLGEIDKLYLEVLNNAKFRFGTLKAETFLALKTAFHESFNFCGYFINNQLVGFSTSMIDGEILDANFVGINYDFNHQYALYQRMLCDFVKLAIAKDLKEVRLGRTAEEIKSCLGAEPVPMKILIKHRNHITNRLMKPLIESIKPSAFDLRKPFKAAVYEQWIQ